MNQANNLQVNKRHHAQSFKEQDRTLTGKQT
jgi:hypothetical protein